MNFEEETEALSTALADEWLRAPTRQLLRDYFKLSRSNPVYFDALALIWKELNGRGEATRPLKNWRQEVDSGDRRRPRWRPMPKHRPVTWAKLLSDLNIQLTIEILRRVGRLPEEDDVSGCRIVSKALATSKDKALRLSDETVRGIWQARFWEKPFEAVVVKHCEAIAKRNGLFHTTKR